MFVPDRLAFRDKVSLPKNVLKFRKIVDIIIC